VPQYLGDLYRKLGVSSARELALLAFRERVSDEGSAGKRAA